MALEKAKRPRAAKHRTLPPDVKSLESMFRSLHADLCRRADHLIREPRDPHARRGLQTLHDQRSAAWTRLAELAPGSALRLAAEFTLQAPNRVQS